MNPIPFNLKRAKAGDPILLHGEPAKFIAHVPEAHEEHRIVVLGKENKIYTFMEDGRMYPMAINCPLTMAPKKRVVWANFYSDSIGGIYENKSIADCFASPSRIACVRVEFEEGEGL